LRSRAAAFSSAISAVGILTPTIPSPVFCGARAADLAMRGSGNKPSTLVKRGDRGRMPERPVLLQAAQPLPF
jgi:hypothetical protein